MELFQQASTPFSPRLLTYDGQMSPVIEEVRRFQTFLFLKEMYSHCKELPHEVSIKKN